MLEKGSRVSVQTIQPSVIYVVIVIWITGSHVLQTRVCCSHIVFFVLQLCVYEHVCADN